MVNTAEPETRQQLRIEVKPIPQDSNITVRERVYQPELIEVILPGAQEPVLIKRRGDADFSRVKPGGTSVKPHAKPHALPSKQQNNFNNQSSGRTGGSDWKVTQPRTRRVANPLIDTSRGEYLGYLLGGALDELIDRPRELREREIPFQDPVNQAFYDLGRGTTNWAEEQLNNIWDLFDDSINNIPDFEIPNFELPQFNFPEFEIPSLDLPSLDLPESNQPAFEFPDFDFNPFNEIDDKYEKQKEDLIEREQLRESDPDSPTTDKQLNDIFKRIPESCFALLIFIQHRVRYYENGYSPQSGRFTATPWRAGRGGASPIRTEKDAYGNSSFSYTNSGDNVGYFMYYPFDFSQPNFTEDPTGKYYVTEFRLAYTYADNRTKAVNLFRFPDGSYATSIGDWAFDSINIYCSVTPPNPPKFPNPYDQRPNLPPNPPKKMSCSCDDIAQILRRTLQSLKYQVKIPVVSCELEDDVWTPKVTEKTIEIFAVDYNTAVAQAEVYRELAVQSKEACEAKNLIERTAKVIGIDDYPVKLPKSLITKSEGFPGNLIPDGEVEAPSLTRFLSWYVERFDEIMGQWEIPIEIKDSDPSTPGDQPKGVKLPNMAEAIAEMFTLNFQSYINTETILNIVVRNLIETGTDKQQNFVTYKLLQSLTDWAGFKQKDIKLEMPLSFNPGKTKFDELLKETKVKVNCVEFDDKFGLEADLMRFREAAAILQAVYKRRLNPNGDIKGQILKYLLDTYNAVKKVNDSDESFSDFINRVENGFTDIPTVGDPTQPYGRPYAQRPKIRDLTDIDEQT